MRPYKAPINILCACDDKYTIMLGALIKSIVTFQPHAVKSTANKFTSPRIPTCAM